MFGLNKQKKVFDFTAEEAAVLGECLRQIGSNDYNVATASQVKFAEAFLNKLRGEIYSDHTQNFYHKVVLPSDASPEFVLDVVGPGEENDFLAYVQPGNGRIPERQIEGDYLIVPTYNIANAVDWLLRHARHARLDIVNRALNAFHKGFQKKINTDSWAVTLTSAYDRNIVVYDADALPGQFTKRLISNGRVTMTRNGGGNATSSNKKMLTDIFLSIEGLEEIRNWNIDQVDEVTRRELSLNPNGDIARILNVTLHPLTELGPNHEYQEFFTSQLGGTLPTGDTELAIGLDLSNTDTFVMPVKQELEVFNDPALHRIQKAGYYGWTEIGFANLDNRNVIALSY